MSLFPLWKPTTQTLRPPVLGITLKTRPVSPVQLTKARDVPSTGDVAVAGASSRRDCVEPMPTVNVVVLPLPPTLPVPALPEPVQSVVLYCVVPIVAEYGNGVRFTLTLP